MTTFSGDQDNLKDSTTEILFPPKIRVNITKLSDFVNTSAPVIVADQNIASWCKQGLAVSDKE